jgi:hypothetical protein
MGKLKIQLEPFSKRVEEGSDFDNESNDESDDDDEPEEEECDHPNYNVFLQFIHETNDEIYNEPFFKETEEESDFDDDSDDDDEPEEEECGHPIYKAFCQLFGESNSELCDVDGEKVTIFKDEELNGYFDRAALIFRNATIQRFSRS